MSNLLSWIGGAWHNILYGHEDGQQVNTGTVVAQAIANTDVTRCMARRVLHELERLENTRIQ